MPRAAPGVTARGVVRRTLIVNRREPVEVVCRCAIWLQHICRRDPHFCPAVSGSLSQFENPSLSSGSWVEPGRLGEVESLAGDCRPPPPGNPRRPSRDDHQKVVIAAGLENLPEDARFIKFLQKWQKNGGVFLPPIRLLSFNNLKKLSNLKILGFI